MSGETFEVAQYRETEKRVETPIQMIYEENGYFISAKPPDDKSVYFHELYIADSDESSDRQVLTFKNKENLTKAYALAVSLAKRDIPPNTIMEILREGKEVLQLG